jgi:hypothetical protein
MGSMLSMIDSGPQEPFEPINNRLIKTRELFTLVYSLVSCFLKECQWWSREPSLSKREGKESSRLIPLLI